jgi:hypothetical protein
MFLSKIWFILVAMLAGVAFSVALTAPRPMAEKLEELEGQRLDRAQYAAEQMLKVDAHKWIDRVANLGRDLVISEALDSASRGSGELSVQHKTVEARLRSLLPDLAGAGIASVVAVDGNGRVVARVGEDEKEYGDSIGGAEVVSDALRGYLSDDVWGTGGQLLRVAGAPVLSKSRDRVVGALYVGADTGRTFAERLKKNLDVDVALLLMGKVVASTLDTRSLALLPEVVDQHRAEIDDVKRTPALSFEVEGDTYLVVAAAFPGQAAEQQGYYVLIGHKPARADLGSVLANTSARDLRWSAFPWLSLVGALLAMIAIGLLLQRYEVEWPIERMRTELRRLSKGEIARLDDHRFGGHFGGIARDVNAALDHANAAISQVGIGAGGAEGAATAEPARMGGPTGVPMPPTPGAPRGAVPAPGSLFGNVPGPMDGFAPPPPPGFAPPGATAYPPPSLPAPPLPPGVRAMGRVPAPPSSAAPASPAFRPSEARTETATATAAAFAAAGSGAGTGVVSSSDPTSPTQTDSEDDDEMHVRAVYGEFINAKQQCGESVAGLTLDKFRLRLQENRNSLMARHACRTVRFAVYVKDGKASLRASPVK